MEILFFKYEDKYKFIAIWIMKIYWKCMDTSSIRKGFTLFWTTLHMANFTRYCKIKVSLTNIELLDIFIKWFKLLNIFMLIKSFIGISNLKISSYQLMTKLNSLILDGQFTSRTIKKEEELIVGLLITFVQKLPSKNNMITGLIYGVWVY